MKKLSLIASAIFLLVLTSYATSPGRKPDAGAQAPSHHASVGAATLLQGRANRLASRYVVGEGPVGVDATSISGAGNSSVKGNYVFKLSNSNARSWGQNLVCNGQTVFVGGMEVRDEAVMGVVSFDGAGNVSGSFTDYGNFDQAASDATVSCSSGGHGVYTAPVTGNITGTYSVQSNGTGSAQFTITGGGVQGGTDTVTLDFLLAGGCSVTGVYDTVLALQLRSDNAVEVNGLLRLQ